MTLFDSTRTLGAPVASFDRNDVRLDASVSGRMGSTLGSPGKTCSRGTRTAVPPDPDHAGEVTSSFPSVSGSASPRRVVCRGGARVASCRMCVLLRHAESRKRKAGAKRRSCRFEGTGLETECSYTNFFSLVSCPLSREIVAPVGNAKPTES